MSLCCWVIVKTTGCLHDRASVHGPVLVDPCCPNLYKSLCHLLKAAPRSSFGLDISPRSMIVVHNSRSSTSSWSTAFHTHHSGEAFHTIDVQWWRCPEKHRWRSRPGGLERGPAYKAPLLKFFNLALENTLEFNPKQLFTTDAVKRGSAEILINS